jgi:hypothetical protein
MKKYSYLPELLHSTPYSSHTPSVIFHFTDFRLLKQRFETYRCFFGSNQNTELKYFKVIHMQITQFSYKLMIEVGISLVHARTNTHTTHTHTHTHTHTKVKVKEIQENHEVISYTLAIQN